MASESEQDEYAYSSDEEGYKLEDDDAEDDDNDDDGDNGFDDDDDDNVKGDMDWEGRSEHSNPNAPPILRLSGRSCSVAVSDTFFRRISTEMYALCAEHVSLFCEPGFFQNSCRFTL